MIKENDHLETRPDFVEANKHASNNLKTFKRVQLAIILFLTPLIVYIFLPILIYVPEIVKHTLLTFVAVTAVHLLDRLVLFKDTEEALDKLKDELRSNVAGQIDSLVQSSNVLTESSLQRIRDGVQAGITEQTQSLVQSSASLEAMARSGIVQIYSTRTHACEDIKQDLISPDNTCIRIIGISMNDFIRGDQISLYEAWKTLGQYIRGELRIKHELDIKVLIIDPRCLGAQLRSKAEVRGQDVDVGRLADDVNAVVHSLVMLESESKSKLAETGVSFECRLYRLPPILSLCLVNSVCYVQQYHFWSARINSTPIPVLKYWKHSDVDRVYPMHSEMIDHFDWIWRRASIPVTNYLDKAETGIDKGLSLCGAVNVYSDHREALDRIKWLLKNAKKKVSIQGISLHSFFRTGELFKAIYNLVEKGEVDIEVLILDPDCNQAKYRSYRERLFVTPHQTFEQYKKDVSQHEESDLYRDTKDSIKNIQTRIDQRFHDKSNLIVKLYDSAPNCFILRVDDTVLVEQYHYGKYVPDEDKGHVPVILGKDMPVVEYSATATSIYDEGDNGSLGNPFRLLEDHFSFTFEQARQIFP